MEIIYIESIDIFIHLIRIAAASFTVFDYIHDRTDTVYTDLSVHTIKSTTVVNNLDSNSPHSGNQSSWKKPTDNT